MKQGTKIKMENFTACHITKQKEGGLFQGMFQSEKTHVTGQKLRKTITHRKQGDLFTIMQLKLI